MILLHLILTQILQQQMQVDVGIRILLGRLVEGHALIVPFVELVTNLLVSAVVCLLWQSDLLVTGGEGIRLLHARLGLGSSYLEFVVLVSEQGLCLALGQGRVHASALSFAFLRHLSRLEHLV